MASSDGNRPPPDGATLYSTVRMEVLRLLERKEGANEDLARLWGFEVDTVHALFKKREDREGRMLYEDLKKLLLELGYLNELDIVVSRMNLQQCDPAFASLSVPRNSSNQRSDLFDHTPHQDRGKTVSSKDVQCRSKSKESHVDPESCDEIPADNYSMVPPIVAVDADMGSHNQTVVAAAAMIHDQETSRAATHLARGDQQVVDWPSLPLAQEKFPAHENSGLNGHRDEEKVSGTGDKQSSISDSTGSSARVQSAVAGEDSGLFSMASAATTTPLFLEQSLQLPATCSSEGILPHPSTDQHAVEATVGMNQTACNNEFEATDSANHDSSLILDVAEPRPITPELAYHPGSPPPVVTGHSSASQTSSDGQEDLNIHQTGNPSCNVDSYVNLYHLVDRLQLKINSLESDMLALSQELARKITESHQLRRLCLEMQQRSEDQRRLNSQLEADNAEQRRMLNDSATMEGESQELLRKITELYQGKCRDCDRMEQDFKLQDARINYLSRRIEAQNGERQEMRETLVELRQLCQENERRLTQRVHEERERLRLEYEQQLEMSVKNTETDKMKMYKRKLQKEKEENRRLRNLVMQMRSREEPPSEDSQGASNAEVFVEDVEDTPSYVASDEASSGSFSEGERALESNPEPDEDPNDLNHVSQDDVDGDTDNEL